MYQPSLIPCQMNDSPAEAECVVIDIPDQTEASADAESTVGISEEKERLSSNNSLAARPSASPNSAAEAAHNLRPSTTLLRVWNSMSNSVSGSPRTSTDDLLDVGHHEAVFNIRATIANLNPQKMARSRCCHRCCLTMLFLLALIAAFSLGWVSQAEYAEMLELEELARAQCRPVRQRPGSEGSASAGPPPIKTLKEFEKVLFPSPGIKELSAKEKTYFKDLANNKEFVEKSAENLLQALDTTKSGTLTRDEVDKLLSLICERCALYSNQTAWVRPRGSWKWGPVITALPPLVQKLWDKGLTCYTREARDKPGKLLDVPKKEIDKFDIENLLRNAFIFGMGHLDPDNKDHLNKGYALTHHNYLRPEFIDYGITDPPAEALADMIASYAAKDAKKKA